jgi:hypothetical protein
MRMPEPRVRAYPQGRLSVRAAAGTCAIDAARASADGWERPWFSHARKLAASNTSASVLPPAESGRTCS